MEKFIDPNSFIPKDDDAMCETEAFCGFPHYNKTNGFWMKTNDLPTVQPAILKLNSRIEVGNSLEMRFDLVGTFLNLLFFAPASGVRIIESSIKLTQTKWRNMDAYYMKLTQGKGSLDPFSFSIILETDSAFSDPVLTITVVTIDSHFEGNAMANEYKNLVDRFPDYTFVQTHQADVSSYAFA